MLVSVIPIGNSKGIRISKAILEQLNIKDKLELEIKDKQLILKQINTKPRIGWEEALRQMAENNEDTLLISEETDSKDFEWVW